MADFKPGKCYALWGDTLNDILGDLRRNRPRGTDGGGVTVDLAPDGSYVSAEWDLDGTPSGGGGGGGDDGLPDSFDETKLYFLKESTVKAFQKAADRNATYAADDTAGLTVDERNQDGIWLSVSD